MVLTSGALRAERLSTRNHNSQSVLDNIVIYKKKIQYIPSYNCSKCGKANYPTFYNDIAKEIQNISKKQALRHTIALKIPFLILGIIINFFM